MPALKAPQNLVFNLVVRTTGGLLSSFVFADDTQLERWRANELPALQKKYGPLSQAVSTLPGLKVGDTCRVYGEGADEFIIEAVVLYSPDRYGFVLNSGCTEEVAKCYV